jgi:hypothetical protein
MKTAQAAARAHIASYLVGPAGVGESEGIATVDRHGSPYVVTFLGFSADGTPAHWRRTVPAPNGKAPDSVQDCVERALTVGRSVELPFSGALEWFGLKGDGFVGFSEEVAGSYSARNPGFPLPEGTMQEAVGTLLARAGLVGIADRISRDSLQCLACHSSFEAGPYLYYARDDEVGVLRRQAAASYPLLARDIATKPTLKFAVDRKQPLAQKLEATYGRNAADQPYMTKALLRRFAGLVQPDHGLPTEVIVQTLGQMPADWFPKTDDDWDALCDLTQEGFRHYARELGLRPDEMCPNTGGKWAEARQRVARAAAPTQPPLDMTEEEMRAWKPVPDESVDGLRSAFTGAYDCVRMFADQVILPVAASAAGDADVPFGPEGDRLAFEAATRILFEKQSIVQTMKLQRHWHTQLAAIIEATADPDAPVTVAQEVAEDGWAPLTDTQVAPNGVYCVPLTDPRQIKDEGSSALDENGVRGLSHCVGGYAQKLRRGESHIVSFREVQPDGSYRRLSTAEFGAPAADSDKLHCIQNRSTGNGAPSREADEACKWFMAEVEARRIPINRDGIMAYLGGRPKITDPIHKKAGYDRRKLDIVDRVLTAWTPYMPKRFRDLGIDGLREAPEMQALVEYVAPRFRTFAP